MFYLNFKNLEIVIEVVLCFNFFNYNIVHIYWKVANLINILGNYHDLFFLMGLKLTKHCCDHL